MYEELLNFLLAKKKRLLSEEEADRLMELIAQSMDMEDDYRERTDNTALIKKILDNVDVEEIIEDESDMRNVIDDLFFDEYSSGSIDCDMIALYGSDDSVEPLSRRKFRRGVGVFSGGRPQDGPKAEPEKKTIGIKDNNRVTKAKHASDGEDGDGKDGASKKMKISETSACPIKDDGAEKMDATSDVLDVPGNNDEEKSAEPQKPREFKLPKFAEASNPSTSSKPLETKFHLPTTRKEKYEEEFLFDLGDLNSVKNAGPDFQFFDENGEKL